MSTKPVMRGLLATRIKRHIIIGCTFAVATAVCYKVFVTDPRKKATAEFYRFVSIMLCMINYAIITIKMFIY